MQGPASFEMTKDPLHHMRAMKGVVLLGVIGRLFDNPYMKEYTTHLEARYRPICWRTLVRLSRILVDCQTKEVIFV